VRESAESYVHDVTISHGNYNLVVFIVCYNTRW